MELLDVRTLVIYETPRHGEAVFGCMVTEGWVGKMKRCEDMVRCWRFIWVETLGSLMSQPSNMFV